MNQLLQFAALSLQFSTMGTYEGAAQAIAATAQISHREHDSAVRELPPEEYRRLSIQVLASAQTKVEMRIKNPALSQNGLDPKIVTALREQRSYLEAQLHNLSDMRVGTKHGIQRSSLVARVNDLSPCRQASIRSVNGRERDVIFTPQAPDNYYKIEGCSFGKLAGQIQLEPHPTSREQTALPIRLQLKPVANSWSDTEIEAYLDAHLSGVLDSPVTLVIFPGKGQRLELPGCFFVARRAEPKLLETVPASWVNLQSSTTAAGRVIRQLEYISPPQSGEGVPNHAAGTSALVLRSDSNSFEAGVDAYGLSRLNPSWKVQSVQLQWYVVSCPGDVMQAHNSGTWTTTWTENGLKVGWVAQSCRSYIPPLFTFDLSSSLYAIKVWVIGPAGTDPVATN
jgi:hypothetical protein